MQQPKPHGHQTGQGSGLPSPVSGAKRTSPPPDHRGTVGRPSGARLGRGAHEQALHHHRDSAGRNRADRIGDHLISPSA